MTLPHLAREPAGDAQGALVLMHGRGVDERDLFPLLDLLDPKRRLLGIAPGAPFEVPPQGRHWYDRPLAPGRPEPETFAQGSSMLAAFLDELGLDWSRTVLGGFSQGGVMAYALGLGEGRPLPAGVIALSSFFPTVEGFALRADVPHGFPVAIGHGARDPMIPVELGRAARDLLAEAGADVVYHESGIGHTIDPRFLATLPDWVSRAVP